jgi:Uma2 family endonuclease
MLNGMKVIIMATNPVKHKWTVEEYLAYERETGSRYEYLDGEIYAMTGGNEKHSIIKYNVSGELRAQLRKAGNCQGYDSDMRIKITDLRYVYPDMSVVCDEAIFADENHTMLTNPNLIVEVLSDSSANYDRGEKANYYRSLPSVQSYLLLEQDRAFAQLYTRHEIGWLLREFEGLEAVVPLDSIGCTLALSEAYLNINWNDKATE